MDYRHTQFGTTLVLILVAILAAVAVEAARRGWPPVGVIVVAVLGLTLPLFFSLTVRVEENFLRLSFGVGVIRRAWPLAEIATVRVVRNPVWSGWGIHRLGGGWLYNVSGPQAVEIVMKTGERVRIGSDEPHALAAALRRRHG